MIKISGLTKKYKEKQVLDNVSITLKKGNIIGIFGENGAGKSTLMRCVTGLTDYIGKIEYDDYRNFALVTEEGSFFAELNALENGEMMSSLYDGFDKKKYSKLLDTFKLPLKVKANKLSKGQQSILEICLGVSKNADYLFLDEPFAGVDIFARRDFMKIILGNKEDNQTIVIASHHIQELQNFLDFVYIIKDGQIINEQDCSEKNIDLFKLMYKSYNRSINF